MEPRLSTRQRLLAKEGLATLLALAALCAAAVVYPLASVGDAGEAKADAPWIFVGLQQLLRLLPPLLGGVLLPAAAVAWLAWLPWLGRRQGLAVPEPMRPNWAEALAWLILAAWAALTALGLWA